MLWAPHAAGMKRAMEHMQKFVGETNGKKFTWEGEKEDNIKMDP
jgi:hypothetical protein